MNLFPTSVRTPRRLVAVAVMAIALMAFSLGLCWPGTGAHEGHAQGMVQHVCALMLGILSTPVLVVMLARRRKLSPANCVRLVGMPLSVLDPPPRLAPLAP